MPDSDDMRIIYAAKYLVDHGFELRKDKKLADFQLYGINPDISIISTDIPTFAGNISGNNIYDYTKEESFALENAYLTAEAAVALAVDETDFSLFNSSILIIGYGRIAKALCALLKPYTPDISVCARSGLQRLDASMGGISTLNFENLAIKNSYDIVFNTVPHPVLNEKELSALPKGTIVIDLASFPGGVDKHIAGALGIRLIEARGLPAKYSTNSAGVVVAKTVIKMIEQKGVFK